MARLSEELKDQASRLIYSSACELRSQTAKALARALDVKFKPLDNMQNLDHGLWQGMLIEDVNASSRRSIANGRNSPRAFARRKAKC